jgi:alginate O-acetyltransferase complex protein AlgJ
MKNSIYPEMVPPNVPRRPNPTNFQRYLTKLKAHPEIVTVDPSPLLMNLKSNMQVFCKTDFHWTDSAAAYVAREVVRKLGDLSKKKEIWNEPIRTVMKKAEAGGESDAMALLWEASETLPYPAGVRIDHQRGEYTKESNAYEWTYLSRQADQSNLLPDTVMFGDSFSDGWIRAGFTGYFTKVRRFYNWEFNKNYKNIPSGTRFLILQHLETIGMLVHTPFWPEELRDN